MASFVGDTKKIFLARHLIYTSKAKIKAFRTFFLSLLETFSGDRDFSLWGKQFGFYKLHCFFGFRPLTLRRFGFFIVARRWVRCILYCRNCFCLLFFFIMISWTRFFFLFHLCYMESGFLCFQTGSHFHIYIFYSCINTGIMCSHNVWFYFFSPGLSNGFLQEIFEFL